jgi:hypothetical protein
LHSAARSIKIGAQLDITNVDEHAMTIGQATRKCLQILSVVLLLSNSQAIAEWRGRVVQTYEYAHPTVPGFTDGFGHALLAVGDKIVVGAPYADPDGIGNAGAIYVYESKSGALLHEIISPDPFSSGQFGGVLSVADGKVLAGSPRDYEDGPTPWVESGRAFRIDPMNSAILDVFNSPDSGPFQEFGRAVAGNGQATVISSRREFGTAYIYNGLAQPIRLTDPLNQSVSDAFGLGVFVDDSFAFITGRNTFAGEPDRLYCYGLSNGQSRGRFDDPTRDTKGAFGYKLAFFGDYLAIAEPYHSYSGADFAGIVYLFDRVTRQLVLTIPNPDPDAFDAFGWSLATVGNNLIVGGQGTDAAYLFDGANGELLLELTAPTAADEEYGISVAAFNNDILVSADDVIYRYRVVPEPSTLMSTAILVFACGCIAWCNVGLGRIKK